MNTGAYGIDLPFPAKPMGEWRGRALCAEKIRNGEVPADFWFPPKGSNTTRQRDICWACPVRVECLDWALSNNEQDGMWGGVSPRNRRQMPKPRVCAECGVAFVQVNVHRKRENTCSEMCARDRKTRLQRDQRRAA